MGTWMICWIPTCTFWAVSDCQNGNLLFDQSSPRVVTVKSGEDPLPNCARPKALALRVVLPAALLGNCVCVFSPSGNLHRQNLSSTAVSVDTPESPRSRWAGAGCCATSAAVCCTGSHFTHLGGQGLLCAVVLGDHLLSMWGFLKMGDLP